MVVFPSLLVVVGLSKGLSIGSGGCGFESLPGGIFRPVKVKTTRGSAPGSSRRGEYTKQKYDSSEVMHHCRSYFLNRDLNSFCSLYTHEMKYFFWVKTQNNYNVIAMICTRLICCYFILICLIYSNVARF